MRTDKELLQALLNAYPNPDSIYLCNLANGLFSWEEYCRFKDIVHPECKEDLSCQGRGSSLSLDGFVGRAHDERGIYITVAKREKLRIDWLTNKINSL